MRKVIVGGEPHSAVRAVNRKNCTMPVHVRQMVLPARHPVGNGMEAAKHAVKQPATNCIFSKGYTKHKRQLSSSHFIESLPRKNR